MRAKKSFDGGVAAVTWVWSWFDSRANAVGQFCCIPFLRCSVATARFRCSSTSDFLTWFSTQSSLNLGCTADASCTFVSANTVPKRLSMSSGSALTRDWQIVRLSGAGQLSNSSSWDLIIQSVGNRQPRPATISPCSTSRPHAVGAMTSTYSLTKVFCMGSRCFPISSPHIYRIWNLQIFEKVLLKSIEYFWAQKSITNTSINTCW